MGSVSDGSSLVFVGSMQIQHSDLSSVSVRPNITAVAAGVFK